MNSTSTNAHSALDQTEYQRQYDEYATRFEATRSQINEVSEQREALIAKRGRIESYLDTLNWQELITEFDEVLWYGTVDQVRVRLGSYPGIRVCVFGCPSLGGRYHLIVDYPNQNVSFDRRKSPVHRF
jgi:hypothetical protein